MWSEKLYEIFPDIRQITYTPAKSWRKDGFCMFSVPKRLLFNQIVKKTFKCSLLGRSFYRQFKIGDETTSNGDIARRFYHSCVFFYFHYTWEDGINWWFIIWIIILWLSFQLWPKTTKIQKPASFLQIAMFLQCTREWKFLFTPLATYNQRMLLFCVDL